MFKIEHTIILDGCGDTIACRCFIEGSNCDDDNCFGLPFLYINNLYAGQSFIVALPDTISRALV